MKLKVFSLVLLSLCVGALLWGQEKSELFQLIQSQFKVLEGKVTKWQVEQETTLDLKSEIVRIKKQLTDLDKFDENYDIHRNNLLSLLSKLESMPVQVSDTILVTAEIISMTKWRVNFWPQNIEESSSVTVIADGTGVVYKVNEGGRFIQVSQYPLKELGSVLRGVLEVQSAIGLMGAPLDDVILSDKNTNELIYNNIQNGISFDVVFDEKLFCNKVVEKSFDTSRLIRDVEALPNNKSIAKFYDSEGNVIQLQSWSKISSDLLFDIKASMFSYEFKPDYRVEIIGADGSVVNINSKDLIDKKITFE